MDGGFLTACRMLAYDGVPGTLPYNNLKLIPP